MFTVAFLIDPLFKDSTVKSVIPPTGCSPDEFPPKPPYILSKLLESKLSFLIPLLEI